MTIYTRIVKEIYVSCTGCGAEFTSNIRPVPEGVAVQDLEKDLVDEFLGRGWALTGLAKAKIVCSSCASILRSTFS